MQRVVREGPRTNVLVNLQRIYIACESCDDDLDFDVINVLITWRILISLRYFSDNNLQRAPRK